MYLTDWSQEFEEFAAIIMTELGLQPPCDVNEALNMYRGREVAIV